MEIWKEIKGYEGLYYASSHGRIKSCVRQKERILKGIINTNGYYRTALYKNGKQKLFTIHQLVAIAFLGHEICKYEKVVNHIDLNKTNNNVDNLEIVTQRENSNRLHCNTSSKYTMSRNNKLREMAEKLPEAPNLVNGKPQYDSSGKLIMANHFRNLKEIEKTVEKRGFSNKSPQMLSAWNEYTQAVIKYNNRKTMRERATYVSVWVFLMVSIVALIIKYWR